MQDVRSAAAVEQISFGGQLLPTFRPGRYACRRYGETSDDASELCEPVLWHSGSGARPLGFPRWVT